MVCLYASPARHDGVALRPVLCGGGGRPELAGSALSCSHSSRRARTAAVGCVRARAPSLCARDKSGLEASSRLAKRARLR